MFFCHSKQILHHSVSVASWTHFGSLEDGITSKSHQLNYENVIGSAKNEKKNEINWKFSSIATIRSLTRSKKIECLIDVEFEVCFWNIFRCSLFLFHWFFLFWIFFITLAVLYLCLTLWPVNYAQNCRLAD